jgi:hypothetical protein
VGFDEFPVYTQEFGVSFAGENADGVLPVKADGLDTLIIV